MKIPKDAIKTPEAAKRLGVSVRRIQQWVTEGRLSAVKVAPRLFLIDPKDLEHLKARVRKPGPQPKAKKSAKPKSK